MKIIKITTLIAAVLGLCSCEQLATIDIPNLSSSIVIESQITTKLEPWKVKISSTQSFNEHHEAETISSANVVIHNNLGDSVTLFYHESGYYMSETNRAAIPGSIYTLDVTYNGQVYSATELCRHQIPIDTLAYYQIESDNPFRKAGYYVFEIASESENTNDFYMWKVYRNDTFLDEFAYLTDDDVIMDQGFLNTWMKGEDIIEQMQMGRIPNAFPNTFQKGDHVRIEQFCINKSYYQFINEFTAQMNRGGTPFDAPAANPQTNLSGGALGYFSVVNVVTAETHIN
ncbi:DUF4249 domain-containing protein [bacterium]|nr:DUF4249 domain-containing protein [bacterium]